MTETTTPVRLLEQDLQTLDTLQESGLIPDKLQLKYPWQQVHYIIEKFVKSIEKEQEQK